MGWPLVAVQCKYMQVQDINTHLMKGSVRRCVQMPAHAEYSMVAEVSSGVDQLLIFSPRPPVCGAPELGQIGALSE